MTTTDKKYISPIDNQPIKTADETLEDWYHAFRLWYANLIIDRAENPSTLFEVNNCARCQGTNLYHHCLFKTCASSTTRTEECLHPRDEEWDEFERLNNTYRCKIIEANIVVGMNQNGGKLPSFSIPLPDPSRLDFGIKT